MTRITIIRHGLSQGNQDKVICGHFDTPLTDSGRKQADLTGRYLKNRKIDRILSSDLSRAFETASIIAGHVGIGVEVEPRLRERACGIFDGKPVNFALSHPEWEGFISRPHINVDGGETIGQVYERAKSFLLDVADANNGKNIVLVTHGGWLWVSVPVVLNIRIDDYFGFIGMDNCSMTNVVWDNGSFVLENLNLTHHLGDNLPESLSWRF
jgi:probable phosphoglycerate mutase